MFAVKSESYRVKAGVIGGEAGRRPSETTTTFVNLHSKCRRSQATSEVCAEMVDLIKCSER
jgi:hypothetical protein